MWTAPLVFVALICAAGAAGFTLPTDDRIHIHLVPHSHCDPGWLESFEGVQTGVCCRWPQTYWRRCLALSSQLTPVSLPRLL
jgi:hypothetical protein